MTCIVGIECNGVLIGADSFAGTGDWAVTNASIPKLFKLKGPDAEWVIGNAGHTRIGQLIRYNFKPPKAPKGKAALERVLVNDVASSIMELLKEAGKLKELDGEKRIKADLIIGVRGRIYRMHSDGCISRNRYGFDAIGSGSDLALGVMYALRDKCCPYEKRLRIALQAGAEFTSYVRPPYRLIRGTE